MAQTFYHDGRAIDLSNCDKEPIHIPGAVQPHGALLVIKEPELTIVQVSANTAEHFGLAPEQLLNQPLARLLGAEAVAALQSEFLPLNLAAPHYLTASAINGQTFERLLHRQQGLLLLECEPQRATPRRPFEHYLAVKSALTRLQHTRSVREFCQLAADEVRRFTGFDRVLIYRFLPDGAGEVIAESLGGDFEPYLGLRYPASDIPQQARALYLKSWLRMKVDVQSARTPLVPLLNPVTQAPTDLSYTALRAMSPIHVEYLKNIGATAAFSLSLIKDEQLWGLVACHHHTGPKYIPHEARVASELLAHFLSLQMGAREAAENHEYVGRLNAEQARFVELMSQAEAYQQGLWQDEAGLCSWLTASGAALCSAEQVKVAGQAPTEEQVRRLAEWLREQVEDEVFATNELAAAYPPAAEFAAVASGVLAVRLGRRQPAYLCWFRPAEAQTVNWAGDPHKAVTVGEFGERLTPRKSFALWRQTVADRAAPWQECEIAAARALRRSILEIIVRQAEELQQLNAELARRNIELDSFAYVASHDLKEPLRGIHNYSYFLLEDYAEQLAEEGVSKLHTLIKLTQRMEALLDSLLYYSRVGRAELALRETNLEEALNEALELLALRLRETAAEIRRPQALPTVRADRERIGEVFTNLIANAVKYNDKAEKWVEIGWQEELEKGERERERETESAESSAPTSTPNSQPPVLIFYVRDNGIGIAPEHHENVFRIFKRLHGREEYGGGVGAGLTIARKIVERHGGRLWLESTPGVGTTFYFTLGAASGQAD